MAEQNNIFFGHFAWYKISQGPLKHFLILIAQKKGKAAIYWELCQVIQPNKTQLTTQMDGFTSLTCGSSIIFVF